MKARTGCRWFSIALVACAVLSYIAEATQTSPERAPAFLQSQLPLSIVITTPAELTKPGNASVEMSGRQAITAVFSRPVIALGSDFGATAEQQKEPFTLSCRMPGKARWVTTAIARFDPDTDWPSDLSCELQWNENLTTYDGAPLQLGTSPRSVRLSSPPLSMRVDGVVSGAATNLTEGLWSAFVGGATVPEVPPDGKILLGFGYPVNLRMLQSALQFNPGEAGDGPPLPFSLAPCQSPAPWALPATVVSGSAAGSGGAAAAPGPPGTADVNTTCAELAPAAKLQPNMTYLLRLPPGARYHPLSGPLRQAASAPVTGLQPFRLTFPQDAFSSAFVGTSYRRLDLWLPHGLAPDTPPAALARQLALFRLPAGNSSAAATAAASEAACVRTPLELAMVSRGRARLIVAQLQPGMQYRITVTANSAVKDGFGQGLQASAYEFWTSYIPHVLAPPTLSQTVAVLEAGAESPLQDWPFVTRGPPLPGPYAYGTPTFAKRLSSWELDLGSDEVKSNVIKMLFQGGFYSRSLEDVFGAPASQLKLPGALVTQGSGANWTELRLPLGGKAGPARARVVAACCSQGGTPLDAKLLLNSSLSFSLLQAYTLGEGRKPAGSDSNSDSDSGGSDSGARLQLTAWVLDSSPGGSGGPVAGARVTVFLQTYSSGPDTQLLASCSTDAEGVCDMSVDLNASTSGSLSAFAEARGSSGRGGGGAVRFAVLPNAGYVSPPAPPEPYVSSLVADRKVVVPGDTLKVTGFVQRNGPVGLQLPDSSFAVLEVNPPFQQEEQEQGPQQQQQLSSGDSASSSSSSSASFSRAAAVAATGAVAVGPGRRTLASGATPRTRLPRSGSATASSSSSSGSTSGFAAVPGAIAAAVRDVSSSSSRRSLSMAAIAADLPYVSKAMPYKGVASTAASTAPSRFPVQLNGTSGTLHGEVRIPKSAKLQPYTLTLRLPYPSSSASTAASVSVSASAGSSAPPPSNAEVDGWPVAGGGAGLGFTVADPRPPTAELKLVSPAWVSPSGRVRLNISAVSYVGASVAHSPLTLTWRHARAAGTLPLLTDAAGAASAAIDLGALPEANRTAPYDELRVEVEWIGPTRERITRSASVTLADGPARLSLQLSLQPELPGAAFAASAALTSNSNAAPLPGLPVTLTLRPHPNDTTAAALCPPTANRRGRGGSGSASSCTVLSGSGGFSPDCQLTLPCVGRFLLEGCAEVPVDGEGNAAAMNSNSSSSSSSGASSRAGSGRAVRVCGNMTLGRNVSEWGAAPLSAHPVPALFPDKSSYAPGEAVRLQLQNPWPGARLLLRWGNTRLLRRKVAGPLPAGLVELTLGSLGSECLGGCSLAGLLDVPRLAPEQLPLPPREQLPVSRLFDPRAPHTVTLPAVTLEVRPDNGLEVRVEVAAVAANSSGDTSSGGSASNAGGITTVRDADGSEVVAIEPGTLANITVHVSYNISDAVVAGPKNDSDSSSGGGSEGQDANDNGNSSNVEVTVYAVDKAFLDLLPYDLPHPEQQMLFRLAADIQSYGMDAYRLAPGAVRAVYDKLMSRLTDLDPWLPVDTQVTPGSVWWGGWGRLRPVAAVDMNDTAYLAGFSTPLTHMPGSVGPFTYVPGGTALAAMAVSADMAAAGGVAGAAANRKVAVPGAAAVVPPNVAASASAAAESAAAADSSSSSGSQSGGGGGAAAAAASLRQQSDFVVTPLFVVASTTMAAAADKQAFAGSVAVTFTAPPNLGAFVIRAFAVAATAAANATASAASSVTSTSTSPSSSAAVRYGAAETRLAVRRRVSLVPSLPRFVRVGDVFEAGVLLTVGSAPAEVALELRVSDPQRSPLRLNATGSPAAGNSSSETKTVTFTTATGLQQEVRFSFSAVSLGSASLSFTARDTQAAGGGDALQLGLDVQGQQGDVWVATSFSLAATNGSSSAANGANSSGTAAAQWREGLQLPDAVPGSGGLTLTAGVGYFPAIAAVYDNLLRTQPDRTYITAQPAVLWITLPAVLSYYGQDLSSLTTSNSSAAGEIHDAIRTAFGDLAKLTSPAVGLMSCEPGRWGSWQPTRTDMPLNSWALLLAQLHAPAMTAPQPSSSSSSSPSAPSLNFSAPWSQLQSASLPLWRGALGRQLAADAAAARQQAGARSGSSSGNSSSSNSSGDVGYSDWNTLAWARLVLGAQWSPEAAPAAVLQDLSLEALVAHRDSMGRQTRLLLALLLQSAGPASPDPALLPELLREVVSALRLQGRTAYVAAGKGSASAAPLADQALSLLLLTRASASSDSASSDSASLSAASLMPLLPRLAAYVASPAPAPRSGGGAGGLWGALARPPSWVEQGLAAAALAEYDRARGSAQPHVSLRAHVNGLSLLQASFQSGGGSSGGTGPTPPPSLRPVSRTTAWQDIPPAPGGGVSQLLFEANGTGEVSLTASLHFVPARPPASPTYRGLYVESILQLLDPLSGGPMGQPLASVPLGSVVAYTVQVTSPDDLGAVTVAVMMPGGLEPLDPNLEPPSGPGYGTMNCGESWIDSYAWSSVYRWWWWPICPAQETRPSLVTFSYAALRAGTSSVTIRAVAATVGTFVVPPIRAFADAQPELMGMTAAGSFTVCANCTAASYGALPPVPVACPAGCGGNGVCDLGSGRCSCDAGFTGEDCSVPVA